MKFKKEHDEEHKGWHYRGYLPHYDGGDVIQFITFRLHDSIPERLLRMWIEQMEVVEKHKAKMMLYAKIEKYLDKCRGNCWLQNPEIAEIVQNALLHFNGERYRQHSWIIMPNHVHALITVLSGNSLSKIIHSWRSYTANQANKVLNRTGSFWHKDYYDRYIRDEKHFRNTKYYIETNAVKAGLVERIEDWRFGSAYRKKPD